MKKLVIVLTAGIFALSACTGNNEQQDAPPATPASTTESTPSDDGIVINAGDNMQFDRAEIRVKEGTTVKLTLRHTGKAPKTAMGHNFVLLKSDASLDAFIAKAAEAKDNDYIPAGSSDIIAYTRLLGGGESDQIEFKAPAKGTYPFVCSFPAHAMMMNGKFIVE